MADHRRGEGQRTHGNARYELGNAGINYQLFRVFSSTRAKYELKGRRITVEAGLNGEHFREIAGKLRETARQCRFVVARRELLELAASFERRAAHFDNRSPPPCCSSN